NFCKYGEGWSNGQFEAHQRGHETLYFFGNGWINQPYTLVMIDIDVMKARGLGTPDGARRCAEHLAGLLPGSYWEPSTNGNGRHGYLLVSKEGYPAEVVNQGLAWLEDWLRAQCKGQDIEMVEVKGTCPVVQWTGSKMDDIR